MSEPATQCRGNGGGGGEGGAGGMRTVECLRGRLLAERVASKAAKEEADQLAARLDELEKRLSNEVKIRDRAERRLRRAIRRLESLKILDVGSSIGSLSSNSNACSGQQAAPEMDGPASSLSTVDSVRSGPREDKGWDGESVKGSSAGSCTQANSSQDGSWFSVVSEQSGSGVCKEEESRAEDSDDAEKCGSGDSAGDVDRDSERYAACRLTMSAFLLQERRAAWSVQRLVKIRSELPRRGRRQARAGAGRQPALQRRAGRDQGEGG
ncbi:uncharacterized protein [Aegilops tauschii subsp. strangulata]|uniref:uncharacterized protein isoform X3 n=1 Tax=Aegilops tauschii subsp. strangulata TaxID=200361 RepID=UPI00098A44C7|nr:uncharacterized protein LOC109780230 isoform X3 [Aegilops tauschii subsp. strangulata]